MHPHNRYRRPYDIALLSERVPELRPFVIVTPDGRSSVDFTQADAVRALNRALLLSDFGLDFWDIPADSLCPGVPGRLDYIHSLADLLGEVKGPVTGLDIGTGGSLIYPILGVRECGWRSVATDSDAVSVRGAEAIVRFNSVLRGRVEVRHQAQPAHIFRGIIHPTDRFTFTMCNPPFFGSAHEAAASARTKWLKLGKRAETPANFGGRGNELWTPGGEEAFVGRMIRESQAFRSQVTWFTTLLSRATHLASMRRVLAKANVGEHRIIAVETGHKRQRLLVWRW